MSKYDFKYIVIGSGPAGSGAALTLARAKKSVALVEGRFFGGSNLNARDIPYGVALDFSHNYAKLFTYPEIVDPYFSLDLSTLPNRELNAIVESGGNNRKLFEDAGVICLKGAAYFKDRHTITVGSKKFSAEYFILATGSQLKADGITGVKSSDCLTPNNAIRATMLPETVAIIGGGSTGCEIASYFAGLGSQVVILESASRILPREDADVSEAISDYFQNQLGITILTGSKVTALKQDMYGKSVVFTESKTKKMLQTDEIVLATGSKPFLDYGLDKAQVKYQPSGITVNRLFQTSSKHIYAVGDCLGQDSSTDRAFYEGSTVATNLINNTKTTINYQGIARLTNTYPEVAAIGLTEAELTKQKRKYKKSVVKLSDTIASKIHNFPYGFVKLLVDRNRHFLGAAIVAPNASLMIEEISLAMRHGFTPLELASTPHISNSYNEAIKLAARQLLSKSTLANKKH